MTRKPYPNDLRLLPPKAELETKAVLKKAIAANKALAELKGAGDLIPNQGVLINAIVLQEAKLSSEIAGAVPARTSYAGQGHMFAKRTCGRDIFKPAVDIFWGCGTLFWRDF